MTLNDLARFLVALIVFVLINTIVFAQNNIKVGVIAPLFKIESSNLYLKDNLIKIIVKQLEQLGALVVTDVLEDLELVVLEPEQQMEVVQQLLVETKLDAIVWSELHLYDDNFEITISMLDKSKEKKTTKISERSIDTEAMSRKVIDVLVELTSELFLDKKIISEICIEGNNRIEKKAIFRIIQSSIGDVFQRDIIARDVKTVYEMGIFRDVIARSEVDSSGLIITFQVKESPVIREVSFSGNHQFSNKKIRENINISEGAFLKKFYIHSFIEELKTMYKEAGYHEIQIAHSINNLENNKVDLEFVIDEGKKIIVDKILFIGNSVFDDKTLKGVIQISEKGTWTWLTGSGKFDDISLLRDENMLFNFYRSNGFANVKIGKTMINIKGATCSLKFMIDEGKRFRIGKIELEGGLPFLETKLRAKFVVAKNDWFDVNLIQRDLVELTKIYSNMGYANVEVHPLTRQCSDDTIELTYVIRENDKVTVKGIKISGNTVTHDHVIRRELKIEENEVFNQDKIKMSLYNIRRLHYFDDVRVEQIKHDNADQINLDFKVREKPTRQITFGAGYSSTDKFFVNGSISQENLMGKGQSLRFSGTLGSGIDRYNLSFNEPWIFGIPLSGTIRLYKEVDEKIGSPNQAYFNKDKKYKQIDTGLYFGISYPLTNFVRVSLDYRYNVSEDKADRQHNKQFLQKYKISSTSLAMFYDSRDGTFYTKNGSRNRLICTCAGLGGDLGFLRSEILLSYYVPLSNNFTLFLRSKYGHIKGIENRDRYKPLRDSDLFHLGGMDSIRAYDYKTIGTEEIRDDQGRIVLAKGGKQYVLLNAELTHPIYEELNLLGVIFYDAGQVFNERLGRVEDGIGVGIRWLSPLGPIRLEAAYKLKDSDGKVKWNFAIGAPF